MQGKRALGRVRSDSMPEVIEHPDLLPWWGISVLVTLLILLLVRRQPWIRGLVLMFSSVFFGLIASYVLSFAVSDRPRDLNFINEEGWGYFIQLLIIGVLPLAIVLKFGRAAPKPHAPAPSPLRDIERVSH